MTYRQEIDGLRAVAVAVVILYHAGVPQLSGGFLGVDIFLVLSGYLITRIIVSQLQDGTFTLRGFYERRARRILPALFLMLLCTVPFAWIWIMPDDFRNYAQGLIASVFSYANIHFWAENDYFATEAGQSPLLHIWSLAVEEQFYMLFPVLALLIVRKRPAALVPVIAGLTAVSLAVCLWGAHAFPSANFYLLPGRAWELLAGGLFSFMVASRSMRVNDGLSLAGLAALAACVFLIDSTVVWPSAVTILPVVATGLVLVFGIRGTLAARLLSFAPLTGLGLISYSAYLWHQPIFAFARIRSMEAPSLSFMLGLALLSLVPAYLSWRFVEQPLRRPAPGGGWRVTCRPLVAGFGIASALLVSTGVAGQVTDGLPGRMPDRVEEMIDESAWSRTCMFSAETGLPDFPMTQCLFNAQHAERYAIWGDSVASALTPVLARELDRRGKSLQQFTHGYCAPLRNVSLEDVEDSRNCGAFTESVLKQILSSGVTTVIMEASWEAFLENHDYLIDGEVHRIVNGDRSAVIERLSQTIRTLEQAGIKVVLVYPHPKSHTRVGDAVARLMLKGVDHPSFIVSQDVFRRETEISRAILDTSASPETIRIQPEESMCQEAAADACVLAKDGVPLISDRLHFTETGAGLVVGQIMRRLFPEASEAERRRDGRAG